MEMMIFARKADTQPRASQVPEISSYESHKKFEQYLEYWTL
jgi:hypothetical protein